MSGPAIELAFGENVDPTTFLDALVALGGVRQPDEHTDGRLSRGSGHVWVYLNPEEGLEPKTQRIMEQKLHGPVRSRVVLDLSREEGSDELALGLIWAAAERWTLVVDTLQHEEARHGILTPEELRSRVKAGDAHP
ncbi:MAG: hypothetical protein GEV04_23915, partial [Actinophytocola sp.]|nr:hypothetical protein [Actinophytocola sp.]